MTAELTSNTAQTFHRLQRSIRTLLLQEMTDEQMVNHLLKLGLTLEVAKFTISSVVNPDLLPNGQLRPLDGRHRDHLSTKASIPLLIETVIRMGENNETHELVTFIKKKWHDPQDIIMASAIGYPIWYLLHCGRINSAFIIAIILTNNGYQNSVIPFALSIGGLLYYDPATEQSGTEMLATQAQRMTEKQQKDTFGQTILAIVPTLLAAFHQDRDDARLLRLLEIIKIVDPHIRHTFDWDAPISRFAQEQWQQRDHENTKLIIHPLPPSDLPRQKRRVLVTGRGIPDDPQRLTETILRTTAAMDKYGWQTESYLIIHSMNWWQRIPEICRQKNIDILFLEDDILTADESNRKQRVEMIAEVRHNNPSIKIVGYLYDSWCLDKPIKKDTFTILDMVWDWTSSSLPLWQEPDLKDKIISLPIPFADMFSPPKQPLTSEILFAGSVKGWNWHRAFWLSVAKHLHMPIKKSLSTHVYDGLPPLESYALYMRRLTESACCLNFTMRPNVDHTCIITGRSFEVILGGSLLVQETAPDMHNFFVAGEHYLEFSSLAELSSVVDFIRENREEAEEIRRRGNAFAREHYSDEKLIGYLDKALFF